jgi:hypothetical protein
VPDPRAAVAGAALRGRDAGDQAHRHHRRHYDGEGQALCPAATGISHHINPWGGIEPCPIVQFTRESIHPGADGRSLRDKFRQSEFLRDFRDLARTTTRGCIVLERPDLLRELVEKHRAADGTVRGTALAELEAMQVRTSQYNPGQEVPERNWLYRLAKRFWFNDFGAYRGLDASRSAPALLSEGLNHRDTEKTVKQGHG